MIYQLPAGANSAQELYFPNAVDIPLNPSGRRGYLMPAKGMNPTMGWKAKKWGNGSNNSSTRRRKGRH